MCWSSPEISPRCELDAIARTRCERTKDGSMDQVVEGSASFRSGMSCAQKEDAAGSSSESRNSSGVEKTQRYHLGGALRCVREVFQLALETVDPELHPLRVGCVLSGVLETVADAWKRDTESNCENDDLVVEDRYSDDHDRNASHRPKRLPGDSQDERTARAVRILWEQAGKDLTRAAYGSASPKYQMLRKVLEANSSTGRKRTQINRCTVPADNDHGECSTFPTILQIIAQIDSTVSSLEEA
ncbi:unnamed protein product [Amoebophrya sp. A25]|nr:unnamed protein product [Amoebophrya sp. A25]|eukprot:GSA25T00013572001.1